MTFEILLIVAAFIAGAIASVTGFGIGSILTPLLSIQVGTGLAVAAVSIPHVLATGLRFWLLRCQVDRRVLLHFGILSAVGGLAGALLHSVAGNPVLAGVFAALLLFAGASELTGKARDLRFGPRTAWIAGACPDSWAALSAIRAAFAPRHCSGSTSIDKLSSRPLRRSAWWSMPLGCRCIS